MNSNGDNFNNFNINGNNMNTNNGNIGSSIAPPLPPRPHQMPTNINSNHRLGNYGIYGNNGFANQLTNYSSLYCNPFSGFGSYGNYGYNRYNNFSNNNNFANNCNENDFVRVAEESSRQAFQSIESIVQAFGSVSMMLESTYYAVHSSFRAVIGVADHFSRLRNHLAQILSTLAIIRTFKWIIRRLLYLIGIRRYHNFDESEERAWTQASHLTPDATFDSLKTSDTSDLFSRGRSSWPIIIFFGVVLGTPWLIWRLLSSINGDHKTASDKWMTGEEEHYEATALYDFQTDSPRELPFRAGQEIIVAPRDLQPRVRGWLLASIDGKKVGLIPANYVRILGCRNAKK